MIYELQDKVKIFQDSMLSYWEVFGRHDLPWRKTKDPWKLLLAEMLLRKTTSKQVVPIYSILEPYSPEEIMIMPKSDLEEIIKPLGIFRVRAAQIQNGAAHICSQKSDIWSKASLLSLPGVGRYIANMVRCSAYNEAFPGLDANMIRVLSRVFNRNTKRKRAREDPDLWDFAEQLVPIKQSKEYNWAIFDFGSAVCTFRNPHCKNCPINNICDFILNREHFLEN